ASFRGTEENRPATQGMAAKFEAIRLDNCDEINAVGFIPDAFNARYAPKASNQGITYNGTIRIVQPPGVEPYTTDMRLVTITLSWRSGNRTVARTLSSYVSRYGLQNYVY